MTRRPRGSTQAVGAREGERRTRELDPDAMAELVRAVGNDQRRTRKFETSELRALGVSLPKKEAPPQPAPTPPPSPSRTVTPRTLAKAGPLVVIERYRKPSGPRKRQG